MHWILLSFKIYMQFKYDRYDIELSFKNEPEIFDTHQCGVDAHSLNACS